ncbi:Signal transduction histidine kinase [Salinimicrobium catena]|uniref:histidine kinase n=1 Tax=Salinimicrobium catena TaxID=390640 RepID=A0A1H5LME0_9FLAO|nr:HAMP domain-containing protein [Salinimicrobium catena]SDL11736.1 Signal transduction histidine kinase [Salinimicrobium catena]SEE78233.1 Signal transduction histidine kinase [Salinimicrobium catena]
MAKRTTSPKTKTKTTSQKVTPTKRPIVKKSKRVAHEEMFKDSDYVHEQLDRLIFALEAFREGDISVRLSKERNDKFADVAEAYNTMVEMIGGVSTEVSRISRVGGIEGNLDARAEFKASSGVWKDMIDNINILIEAIAKPVLEVSRILNSIAAGKLEDKFSLTVTGDFRAMADVINRTLGSLNIFAEQVTQVAREVGVEGKLGGQASVPNVSGTWKDLTDNVNQMASNLTEQVREIAGVTTAVADGDLSRKITEEGKGGEVLGLSTTINRMVDSLNIFAAEVTNVAREVGVEGKLGGQANVPNVAGTWKDLTVNVNTMASNLTAQVREIAGVATSVANGDLSKKISINVKGEIAELKDTINQMVDSLNIFSDEVTRVAREVGTEGKLGGQAEVPDVAGTWKDLTDNVNTMASNLTNQVREIASVTTAVAQGDLSQKITEEGKGGEVLILSNTINSMVDSLTLFAAEVTRVAREVGTEGKLGGQATVPSAAGTWKDLTDNVNIMASNLTTQVREIANVATAVADGDLSQKITIDVKGEIAELKDTINQMVDSLNIFSDEVTRVAREVGTEGILGGQAKVPDVAGTWKDLTDNVNYMASNLTTQVREIANVATAVAKGDLAQKIAIEAKGEIAELKETINTMVDSLNIFSDEVTRVAREVGTEGILGGQAEVPNVGGAWLELTENVNTMASNLTTQVREIASVTKAVANGDLSKKISEEEKGGEVLELSTIINTMVDSLNILSNEVTRVAREVGTEGMLGGQAEVPNVAGAWLDLTGNVNTMASNLTSQVREIANVATAVANGDLSQKISIDVKGEIAELKDTINQMVDSLNVFAAEVTRVAREVGTEGMLGGQAKVPNVAGTWKGLTDNVNTMASNLTTQVREIASVTTAVANGDLSQKISEQGKGGEVLELSTTINRMVDALNIFADEVTNVAREVGTEGILGGQAEVPNVAGSWKDLTDNVNQMASNLTSQVRDIAGVSTALARGDFSRKIDVEVKGEVQELKNNINAMVDSFTTIVKAANTIAEGNFSIEMPLRSEADQLGIALNSMTENLKRISEENENEAWIKTGQAGLNDRMRGEQDLLTLSKNIISYLTKYLDGQVGVIYLAEKNNDKKQLRMTGSYAFTHRKSLKTTFDFGEGLVGQAASEKEPIVLSGIPTDYISVSSGLGEKTPRHILVQPFMIDGEVRGVIEIGSFKAFNDNQLELVRSVGENIAITTNVSLDREKMKDLLEESQRQSEELLNQQEKLKIQSQELQMANDDLESKTKDLEMQKEDLQSSRVEVERKAKELELASKYKSEFLANMSHELRTPLNSLLILSKDLSDNRKGNLYKDQQKSASIIYEGGLNLLNLINDILDLSKVEAGKLQIHPEDILIENLIDNLQNQFEPLAKSKKLKFTIQRKANVPERIVTDGQRLEQIIKNLISNAIKFTEKGSVSVSISKPGSGVNFREITLPHSEVLEIAVKDTGIGIPEAKRMMIFEAFQQAEGGISRQYGGTGLGLTISRELSRLLGGEIHIESTEGKGSIFKVYVPTDLNSAPIKEMDDAISSYSKSKNSISQESKVIDLEKEKSEDIPEAHIPDDRDNLKASENSLLIIDEDRFFGQLVRRVVRKDGYKLLFAKDGKEGMKLAAQYQPNGIFLSEPLPDMRGLIVLDHLKFSLETRHIPVFFTSEEDHRHEALSKGAMGFSFKPVSNKDIENTIKRIEKLHDSLSKEVLIVEDDEASLKAIRSTLQNKQINISTAVTGQDALDTIRSQRFDCIILDLKLPDITGFEVLKKLNSGKKDFNVPVVVYTGKELTKKEVKELHKFADSILIKGASTPEHLLDEVSLFLHSDENKLSSRQKKIMADLHNPKHLLKDKKVLVVDDDKRNSYALTKALTESGMKVVVAENGKLAIEKLEEEKDVDVVLMDVMMPVMNGYEATTQIREYDAFKDLPIISLTAKAMPEDKAKSLEAGANDYLTKPVNIDKLLNIVRLWLYQ